MIRAIILGFLLLLTTSVQSGEFSFFDKTLVYTGRIVNVDYYQFMKSVDDIGITNVVMTNSPGGHFSDAVRIGLDITALGINTYAFGDCFSSCAYIWLAGKNRYIIDAKHTRIGIHYPYLIDRTQTPSGADVGRTVNARFRWYLSYFGLSDDVIDRIAATGPTKLIYLTPSKLEKFGIAATVITQEEAEEHFGIR